MRHGIANMAEGIIALSPKGSAIHWEEMPDGAWMCAVTRRRVKPSGEHTRVVRYAIAATGQRAAELVLDALWGES